MHLIPNPLSEAERGQVVTLFRRRSILCNDTAWQFMYNGRDALWRTLALRVANKNPPESIFWRSVLFVRLRWL